MKKDIPEEVIKKAGEVIPEEDPATINIEIEVPVFTDLIGSIDIDVIVLIMIVFIGKSYTYI